MTDARGSHGGRPKDAKTFWASFCRARGVPESTPHEVWHFGHTADLANELADLVVCGRKRATASLGWVYECHPEERPVVGAFSVITQLDGTPRAVIRTTHVETRPFSDVPAEFAWEEGEGDRSLADWRRAHWAFFTAECEALGRRPREDMPVVLERFELLHPPAPDRESGPSSADGPPPVP